MAAAGLAGLVPIDTLTSYGMNAMSASMAWDRQKNLMTRGPGYAMQGLKNAGINPILAAGAGIKGGPQGSAQMAHAAQSGKGKNPILDALTARNVEASTAKLTAEASAQNYQNVGLGAEADYMGSPEGIGTMIRDRVNRSLPDSIPGLIGKGAFGSIGTARDIWNKNAPNFMDPIKSFLRKHGSQPKTSGPQFGPPTPSGKPGFTPRKR